MTNYPPGWYGFSEDAERRWYDYYAVAMWGMLPDGTVTKNLAHPSCKPVFLMTNDRPGNPQVSEDWELLELYWEFDGVENFWSDGHRFAYPYGPEPNTPTLFDPPISASIEDRIGIRAAIWKFGRRTAREVLEIS
jgi:hypothetical protein